MIDKKMEELEKKYSPKSESITSMLEDYITPRNMELLTRLITVELISSHLNGVNETMETTLEII